MKTTAITQHTLVHLEVLGYKLGHGDKTYTKEEILDSPYIFLDSRLKEISLSTSANDYRRSERKEVTYFDILAIQPESEKEMSVIEKTARELLALLNSEENRYVSGYEMVFDIEKEEYSISESWFIFPITDWACGGISLEIMDICLKFKADTLRHYYFTIARGELSKKYSSHGLPAIKISL